MALSDKPPPPPQPSQSNAAPQPLVSVSVQRAGALPSYYPTQTPNNAAAGPSTLPNQYAPNPAWKNGWTMAAYPYTSSQTITPYPQQQYLYAHPKAGLGASTTPGITAATTAALNFASNVPKPPSPIPSPSEPCKNWDYALKSFMESVGLTQALRGLERDMLVLNSDWENQKVPGALQELANNIQKIQQGQLEQRSLEDRKIDHVRLSNGFEPKTPTSLTKSISTFLAQKRANNEASNRAEFLRSLAKLRPQDETSSDASNLESPSSCARTDAKAIDRNAQIKYDIVKNEDGPLRRTMRNHDVSGSTTTTVLPSTSTYKGKAKATTFKNEKAEATVVKDLSSERHPGLDDRLTNIENHLAIRYVPYAPQSLLDRLRFLEEHIIKLEKDYPPWAAIHFNQPSRNWPPPPKQMPIIVPTSMSRQPKLDAPSYSASIAGAASYAGGLTRVKNSSLHRAVMEKLEVHNAKLDLSGGR
ncbi:hypothetical protein F5876DRAFT_71714 [Lentinula aff. lateritia]|uniref:Uncharacterized protein n=1 Tax=Lentinula aff. lateritia TaxID=2804960 RepID=A0ACC1UG40_9AGAR|nr:hypothetical protein F5876DRAFT_71714 [Lentinula aff. lateritia]